MTTWRSRKGLALACGVLLASVVLSRSATTHAQTARLEIFVNWGDQLAYQGSSNGGLTWDPFRPHPNSEVLFRGAPAAVSDRAGHIVVAVREHGNIRVSEFFTNPDRWNGFPILASGGGRTINGTR